MVTKGCLPGTNQARGGQRYGRPKHAGATRKRVNQLATAQLDQGRTLQHWLRPAPLNQIRLLEEELIARWRTRTTGWNVG
jgi:hypothetical protein